MTDLVEINKCKVRGLLLALEHKMSGSELAIFGDSEHMPVINLFSNGIYVREIHIPKGSFVMGKIHLHEHPNILVSGSVIMMTDAGVERITAPHTMVSPAGIKRFLYTFEDTIWITLHRTDQTTAIEAEADIIASNYEEMDMEYDAILTKLTGEL